MPEQLKPCPFCGCEPGCADDDVFHRCRVIGMSINVFRYEWNTRAPLPYVHGVKFERACDGCTDAQCLRDAGCPRGLKAE